MKFSFTGFVFAGLLGFSSLLQAQDSDPPAARAPAPELPIRSYFGAESFAYRSTTNFTTSTGSWDNYGDPLVGTGSANTQSANSTQSGLAVRGGASSNYFDVDASLAVLSKGLGTIGDISAFVYSGGGYAGGITSRWNPGYVQVAVQPLGLGYADEHFHIAATVFAGGEQDLAHSQIGSVVWGASLRAKARPTSAIDLGVVFEGGCLSNWLSSNQEYQPVAGCRGRVTGEFGWNFAHNAQITAHAAYEAFDETAGNIKGGAVSTTVDNAEDVGHFATVGLGLKYVH